MKHQLSTILEQSSEGRVGSRHLNTHGSQGSSEAGSTKHRLVSRKDLSSDEEQKEVNPFGENITKQQKDVYIDFSQVHTAQKEDFENDGDDSFEREDESDAEASDEDETSLPNTAFVKNTATNSIPSSDKHDETSPQFS